jgi:hypothetical protein
MVKRSLVRISLAAAFAVALYGGLAMAASNECSRVGMWHGEGDAGFTWMATASPGANATNGQFTLEWIVIDPTLGGFFPDVARVTNAFGVWKKVDQHTYQFTWMAYGFDADGKLAYTARTSGTESMVNCDRIDIEYVLQLWLTDMDLSTDAPIFCAPGTATEIRMSLVQASCPVP